MKLKILFSILICNHILLCSAQKGVFFAEGNTREKEICITIDDGPSKNTVQLLGLLDKHKIKGTFFVLGVNADKYPENVREILKRGHELGSHLYHHTNYYRYKEPDIKQKISEHIQKMNSSLLAITGSETKLLRMPHGYSRQPAREAAQENGMFLINWSFGYDWHKISKEEMIKKYKAALKPGAVFLFHDAGTNAPMRMEVLEELIMHAKSEGYSFLTASEMFRLK